MVSQLSMSENGWHAFKIGCERVWTWLKATAAPCTFVALVEPMAARPASPETLLASREAPSAGTEDDIDVEAKGLKLAA